MRKWNLSEASGKIFSGDWIAGEAGKYEVVSPGDGSVVGFTGVASEDDVERAGEIATKAQIIWGDTSYVERAAVMRRAREILTENRAEVESLLMRESGSLSGKAHHEVQKVIDELDAAEALITQPTGQLLPVENPATLGIARRVPVGVVGVIAPWNAPFMLAMRSVAPAIALGNAVIVKPDIKTAISGGAVIAEMFAAAGLPEGVLHIMPGEAAVGEAVVRSKYTSVISFTGSSGAGRRVGEVAGSMMKRVILELGGNNATIVMADCDLDNAVASGIAGTFRHGGQICMATGRHIVHESIADEYVSRLTEAAANMKLGAPGQEGVTLGPLISELQAERVQEVVDAAVAGGATVLHGGSHEGTFFQPTVLDGVTADNPAFEREIFGPVAPVIRFSTDEEAIELANSTAYGLTAAIHTKDIAKALAITSRLKVGMIALNGQTIYDAAHIPMGGMGASGNGGRHGGQWNLDEFTYWQWITVPTLS